MKKKLLKPPSGDGEILFLPGVEQFSKALRNGGMLSTCHQLHFFHPGIGIRFHLVDLIQREDKCIVFMDTDRTDLRVRIPWVGRIPTHGGGPWVGDIPPTHGSGPSPEVIGASGKVGGPSSQGMVSPEKERSKVFAFVKSERPLYTFSSLESERVEGFFKEIESHLGNVFRDTGCSCLQEFKRFSEIFLGQDPSLPLRERLADAFFRFNGITARHVFLTELLAGEEYSEFLGRIYTEAERFRAVYNQSIDRYGDLFRFRFRNYPFPKLKEGELPFWIIRDDRRHQLSTNRVDASDLKRYTIVPKASPLTLFFRLHVAGVFMHGVGGANYEWINEQILEGFYHVEPSPYFVMSATFHLCHIPVRDFPYFFMNPGVPRSTLKRYFESRGSTVLT
jgi:hypothetical protein